jgi:hypothetical protein
MHILLRILAQADLRKMRDATWRRSESEVIRVNSKTTLVIKVESVDCLPFSFCTGTAKASSF